jgi:ABC-type phosphate transport system substrate-binding protein
VAGNRPLAAFIAALTRWRAGLSRVTLALFLAACAVAPEASPTPQPALPLVAVTPSLEPLVRGWLERYAEAQGVPEFDLTIRTRQAAEEEAQAGEIALVVAAGAPPAGWFATPLGHEALAVVVHPENPVRAFQADQLASIFSGETRRWDALSGPNTEIQPLVPVEGDELRTLFADRILGLRRVTSSARLAASPEDMAGLVAGDPGRIGLLPWSAVDERLLVAAIDGRLPSDDSIAAGDYPFTLDVIAMAPEEPQGALRAWLVWMQAQPPEG